MSRELAHLAESEDMTSFTLERIFRAPAPDETQALELRASLLADSTVSLFVSRLIDASSDR
jgi:hypothetical protein